MNTHESSSDITTPEAEVESAKTNKERVLSAFSRWQSNAKKYLTSGKESFRQMMKRVDASFQTFKANNTFTRFSQKGEEIEGPLMREEYGVSGEAGDRNSVIILLSKGYIQTRQFLLGLYSSVKESMTGWYRKISRSGRDMLDSRLHHKDQREKNTTATMRQKILDRMGLVEKSEMERIQQQLERMTTLTEKSKHHHVPANPIGERRSGDRRTESLAVVYERRYQNRRAA